MRPEANPNKLIIALKRAIADTFDDGKWRELGYLTDTIQLIENHGRLLRSLYWGDNDYEGCILQVWLFRYVITVSIHGHFRPMPHESASWVSGSSRAKTYGKEWLSSLKP